MVRQVVRAGESVHVGAAASVQFAGDRSVWLRVIRVHDRPTYDGWVWLDAYVLNEVGDAVDRRTVFVQADGLVKVKNMPIPRDRAGERRAA